MKKNIEASNQSRSFFSTIRGNLVVYSGLVIVFVCVVVAVFYFVMKNSLVTNAEIIIRGNTEKIALQIGESSLKAMTIAKTMAIAQENGLFGKRKKSIEFARKVLEKYPFLTGVSIGYDANADQNDKRYLDNNPDNYKAMDANGRFLPYWFVAGSDYELSHLIDMEKSLYYKGCRERYYSNEKDKANFTEPYIYEGKMIVEHTYPIAIDGQFVGMAGADKALLDLNDYLGSVAPYESSEFVLISAQGRVLSSNMTLASEETFQNALEQMQKVNSGIDVSPLDTKMLTFYIGDTDYGQLLTTFYEMEGKARLIRARDILTGEIYYYSGSKIETGNWTFVMRVSEGEIVAPANAILIKVLLFVVVGIILMVLVTISFSRKITKPISLIIDASAGLAKGKFDISLPEFPVYEVNRLKNTMISTASGLTQLKNKLSQRTKELQNERKQLKITLQSIGDGVISTDISGNVTFLNKAASRLTGWSQTEAYGRALTDVYNIIDAETRDKVVESVERVLKHGDVVEISDHAVLVSKGTSEYYVATSVASILDRLGEINGAVLVFRDVTELINQEQKQDQLRELLAHRNKMDAIGQLAGGVAHDFNNMLGGIMGAAQLLQLPKRNLDKKSLSYVDLILKSSTRAADLTSKLLAFGRKGKMVGSDIDVHAIIDDCVDILTKTIDKKVSISTTKSADDFIVAGDITAIQNSLINLGINASHAMKKGGELTFNTKNIVLDHDFCDASVFEVVPGNYIEILVKDTGAGMNSDVLEKIFEPFFTTKDPGQGTGLGLASVYGTVQDHCGVVDVESSIGVGTVFHVYLPISTSGVEEIAFAPKKEFMPGTGKIILIDDEEIIRITGSHMLEEMGYKVATFENGLDAIETFRHQYQQIDLVITDMIMPEINGKELFYKLREIDANCKVIISSGFARNENIDSLKRDGLSGFINKPFTDVELSQLLVGILKNG